MKITNTKDYVSQGVKLLVYGQSGVGKTFLCSTAPSPIILSAESGLLSLVDFDIPVIEIMSLSALVDAYKWCATSDEAAAYQTICIDSLSDIAETVLSGHIKNTKDPRQAYGAMADDMAAAIRRFRDLKGRHVYFSAKIKRVTEDSTGISSFMPGVPGQMLLQNLPFFFDEVFVYQYKKVGKTKQRWLQTDGDRQYVAKDRSGKLESMEKPDLTHIIDKIGEPKHGTTTPTR